MAKILVNAGYAVHVVEWDRTGSKPGIEIKDGIVFKRLRLKAGYSLSTVHLTPIWLIYVFIQMILGNYDIVQPQNLDCLLPVLLYSKFVQRKRIIYDLADFYSDAFVVGIPVISWIANHLEKLMTKCPDALILASERQILQVEARNLPQKTVTFYNMPDAYFFSSSIEDSDFIGKKNGSEFTLFYAGQLGYDRVRLLLNVIEIIKRLPVKILIAGYGPYVGYFRRLSEVNKQVQFLGFLSQEKVLQFSKKADLILLPYDPSYFNNRIGLPSKLFESMAGGGLVLAPLGTYMGEIVQREKIGFVADYKSLKNLRRVLELVIGSEESCIRLLKQNARIVYLQEFNPQKIRDAYLGIVESVCVSRRT